MNKPQQPAECDCSTTGRHHYPKRVCAFCGVEDKPDAAQDSPEGLVLPPLIEMSTARLDRAKIRWNGGVAAAKEEIRRYSGNSGAYDPEECSGTTAMFALTDRERQLMDALRRATEAETELQALALIRGVNHLLGEPPPTLEEYLEMHRRATEAEERVKELEAQVANLTEQIALLKALGTTERR